MAQSLIMYSGGYEPFRGYSIAGGSGSLVGKFEDLQPYPTSSLLALLSACGWRSVLSASCPGCLLPYLPPAIEGSPDSESINQKQTLP